MDPQDDPFLESLFSTLGRSLFALPGETFVDQVRRWMNAWSYTVSLKPRNRPEWLQAIEVTTYQFAAVYSLVLRKRKGISQKQRMRYGQDFLTAIKAMTDARMRYDLLRTSRAK